MRKVINSDGFSLIELLVALGIMGAFVIGFMRLSDKIVQSESKMMDLMEINDLSARIRYILNDSQACNKTLMVNKQGDNYLLPSELEKVNDRNNKPVIEAGKNDGRLFIKSIRISADKVKKNHIVEEPIFVKLFVDLKGRSSLLKNKSIKVTLPVLVEAGEGDDVHLLYCDSLSSGVAQEMTNAIMKRMCSSFNIPYDEVSGKCKFNGFGNDSPLFQKELIENIQKLLPKHLNQ
jgi:prepilin-type N-terminal cleavage/methylation domain-containing protein